MRKPSVLLLFWLALTLALPLQAFAVYAASGCPMGMSHMQMDMPQNDCDSCQANGCALMSFCQNLQAGLSVHIPVVAIDASSATPQTFSSTFRSLILAPPERPPRHA